MVEFIFKYGKKKKVLSIKYCEIYNLLIIQSIIIQSK